MTTSERGGTTDPSPQDVSRDDARYAAWFHELDAWTEYWDLYHPETRGRFYFGDGVAESGLLSRFLPRERRPQAFVAWRLFALACNDGADFVREVRRPEVAAAVMEVDALVSRLFAKHFGDARDPRATADYLESIFRLATDSLPPATERDARVAADDPRKSTAGRHMIEGDVMWFAWALQLEAAHAIVGRDVQRLDPDHARRALMLAGVATGCPADFAWRGHRRTRPEYSRGDATARLLRGRGIEWASDFDAAAGEVRALYRIREFGSDE